MTKLLFTLLTAMVFSFAAATSSFAEFTPPAKTFPKEATGTYALDASHANVLFSVKHLGFSNYFGRFNKMEGSLDFDAADITKSKITMKIYTASVDTNNSELEAKLLDKQFLSTENFPVATFVSTKIEKLSDDKGRLTGNLTMLGKTMPVSLDVIFNGYAVNPYSKAPTMGFSANGTFKRSDFGMNAYVPDVSDEVSLVIETEFNKTDSKE